MTCLEVEEGGSGGGGDASHKNRIKRRAGALEEEGVTSGEAELLCASRR